DQVRFPGFGVGKMSISNPSGRSFAASSSSSLFSLPGGLLLSTRISSISRSAVGLAARAKVARQRARRKRCIGAYSILISMFAEKAVKISQLPSFRAEHFPYAGPYPWLDRPDALERIEEKLRVGEISAADAEQCRHWHLDGYIILEKLFNDETLDAVWSSYERAVQQGKIKLAPEPAAEGDPYPGRYLNPHKKAGAFCRILKNAALLHWVRLLMEREPKPLQTI